MTLTEEQQAAVDEYQRQVAINIQKRNAHMAAEDVARQAMLDWEIANKGLQEARSNLLLLLGTKEGDPAGVAMHAPR